MILIYIHLKECLGQKHYFKAEIYLLNKDLLNENIDCIEKFMSYIFTELFPLLNNEKINDYNTLITIEDNLEK